MYRFRKVEYLLDEKYDELKNQEIYFASPEELNDPMEGVKDIFWRGDEIVWRNFIKNYLICLEHVISMWNVVGEYKEINEDFIPAVKSSIKFSSSKHKERFEKIENYFFSNEIIKNIPLFLAHNDRKIRFNELLKYMEIVHKFAFDAINVVNADYGYMDRINIFKDILQDNNSLKKLESGKDRENKDTIHNVELIFEKLSKSLNNINSYFRLRPSNNEEDKVQFKNRTFIMVKFPEAYLRKMEEIVHPKWYAACFMNECSSLSSWGIYGDNHKGVCLKFKTESNENDESKFLKLNGIIGNRTSSIIGSYDYEVKKMRYDNILNEIDFFKALGRISYPDFNEQWYADEKGHISSTVHNMRFDEEWFNTYKKEFYKNILTKSREYSFENEYRITIDELFNDYSSSEDRKVKYDFNNLEGIIFGIKTSNQDKEKIIDIIREKCLESGRKNFDFYNAQYSHESGKIECVKIDIIL